MKGSPHERFPAPFLDETQSQRPARHITNVCEEFYLAVFHSTGKEQGKQTIVEVISVFQP